MGRSFKGDIPRLVDVVMEEHAILWSEEKVLHTHCGSTASRSATIADDLCIALADPLLSCECDCVESSY